MRDFFGVVSGVTWGTLPVRGQKKWRELECDVNKTDASVPVAFSYTTKDIRSMDCLKLKSVFGVQTGVSWGAMTPVAQKTWREKHCDKLLGSETLGFTNAAINAMDCDVIKKTFAVVGEGEWGGLTAGGQTIWRRKQCTAYFLKGTVMENPNYLPTAFPTVQPTIEHEFSTKTTNVTKVIAECDGGLSNRVRVMIFYSYYSRWKYDGAGLFFVWEVNDACPGHFLDIFEPVQGVTFISKAEADSMESDVSVLRFRPSRDSVEILVKRFITNIGQYRIWDIGLRKITLRDHIQRKVYGYVVANDICNVYGIHVRRTDLHDGLDSMRKLTYPTIFRTISKLNVTGITLFLATDNAATQARFEFHYEVREPERVSKLLVYRRIDGDAVNKKLQSGNYSSEFRHTDLETAVIDLYILSYTKHFTRGLYSSFSEWVNWLRVMREPEWRNEPTCPSVQHPQIK
jgi:hypothetical protein